MTDEEKHAEMQALMERVDIAYRERRAAEYEHRSAEVIRLLIQQERQVLAQAVALFRRLYVRT